MKFSIIVITYNRKNELEACIASIKAQKTDWLFETIVIYNGETLNLEKKKTSSLPFYQSYFIPANTPSFARNFALTKASGEYILFLDDDCFLPEDYLSKVNFSQEWDVLGGPDRTPPQASSLQKLVGKALSSPFCMGPTFKRHSSFAKSINTHSNEQELILCNLWVKKDIFLKEGHRFENSLFRNEENHLLKKLKIENKKIFYDPNLYVYHSRKSTLETLSSSIIKSGESRVQNYLKLPAHIELVYLLPLVFSLFFILWVFNPTSFLSIIFLTYIGLTYLYGLLFLKVLHPGFTGLHFFILFFYSYGLMREITTRLFSVYKRLRTSST